MSFKYLLFIGLSCLFVALSLENLTSPSIISAGNCESLLKKNSSFLNKCNFEHYIDEFNWNDRNADIQPTTIPNTKAWGFLSANIPFFECPDKVCASDTIIALIHFLTTVHFLDP